jgi:ligand-binding sensor domain-containing protein/putative methionine-R-sulfoxide reductase with GAF domain
VQKNLLLSLIPLKPFFFGVLVLCCPNKIILAQQQPYFNNLTEKDGLSNNRVTCFYKDKTGYMWIGTESGLNMYNGNSWKIYKPSAQKKNYLSNSFITHIEQDSRGNMWVSTRKGLNRIDLSAGITEVFLPEDTTRLNQIPSDLVWDAYPDTDTSIWIAADGKAFCRYNPAAEKFYYYNFRGQPDKNNIGLGPGYHSIFRILPHGAGDLWLATTDGIFSFNKQTGRFTHEFTVTLGEISFFYFDERIGKLYFADYGNLLYVYDPAQKQTTTVSLQRDMYAGKYMPAFNKHDKLLLVPAAGGLAAVSEKNEVEYFLEATGNRENDLLPGSVNCVYKDRQQITWVGTVNGISKFVPVLNNNLHLSFANNLSLDPDLVVKNFMYYPPGNEWLIASWKDNSVFVANNETGMVKQLQKPAAFRNDTCYALYAHGRDTVFMLSGGALLTYDGQFKKWGKIVFPPPYNTSIVTCIAIDPAGNYWVGNNRKELFIYNPHTRHVWAPSKEDIWENATICLVADARNNCMWIGTSGYGVIKYDFGKKDFAYMDPDNQVKTALHSYVVNDIVLDGKGDFWVATFEGGLAKYTVSLPADKGFTNYDIQSGLPDDNVYSVATDHAGGVWFTTINGIGHIGADGSSKGLYNQRSGLPYSKFQQSIEALPDGKIAAVTENNFICFDPAAITTPLDYPVMLDDIVANDTVAVSIDTSSGQHDFAYTRNAFTFNFSVLDFISPGAVEYFYMLEGLEKNWVAAGKQHRVRYAELPPGEYSFKVKAKRENGGFYLQEGRFSFRILPPFWQSWWFILLLAALAVLLVYLFVRWRIKGIRAVETAKLKVQELNAEKLKSQLELEQIVNYFSSSLINKNTVDDVLWDLAKNLIGRLGFEDCMIYLWNTDKTKMVQRAGYGPKGSIEEIRKQVFEVVPGQGVVGHVMQTKEPLLIADTSRDTRYRADEMVRLSEITVPIIYNNELTGIIDSEHQQANFFTQQHVQVMSTIATLVATKINSIASEQSLQLAKIEMLEMNEKLAAARLEALRSQMNPHFIFNCLNSIDNLIQNNDRDKATLYLAKFARLIRSVLENSTTNLVPCWKDMETLGVYIELESLRMEEKFQYSISIAPEILNGDYKVPPLVIQPFVENAIHHGLLNKIDANRTLLVSVSVAGQYICYAVEDNGVGRARAAAYKELNKAAHVSMGMQMSIDRINLFNQHHNGAVKIIDLFDAAHQPAGTRVEVEIVNQ